MIDSKFDNIKLKNINFYPSLNHQTLSSVTINILYKPQVQVTIDSDNDTLKQGDEVRLICNVNSKPEHSGKYTWYHNNGLLKKATKKVLYIEHLIPDDHNSRFTCRVNNALGSGSNKILLNVKYEPKFISSSQVKIVNQNEMAEFYCETHGNPKHRIYWRKSGDEQIIHEGSNFTIKNVKKWQTVRANDTVFVNHESIATLSCEFHGYPKPGDIIWTFNGENIITNRPSKRFNVIQIDKNYGVDSKLIIYNLESKDSGNYNCTALTIYTTVTTTISLHSYTFIYQVTFITTDINLSYATTILRYDGINTRTFCSNDKSHL
ncbi:Poly-glutamine tract binding protein 1 [Strongyloides ratti]|uniref:Poly-glutamine tract binding protein 1 n=1 Tax=Strongyloides ratti TaxID=34506 RepID=A0A090LNH0_STRRB|nr:Poly-glutamine tract binding protein 1 [Strongyloides ratti]CEF71291.1 Poly-glutamine tract binding protein 1 [Strongyloides ratti]